MEKKKPFTQRFFEDKKYTTARAWYYFIYLLLIILYVVTGVVFLQCIKSGNIQGAAKLNVLMYLIGAPWVAMNFYYAYYYVWISKCNPPDNTEEDDEEDNDDEGIDWEAFYAEMRQKRRSDYN